MNKFVKSLSVLALVSMSSVAFGQSSSPAPEAAPTQATELTINHEIDSFGGNEALYMKAKALNPQVESEVVQNRFIKRSNRIEFAPEVASVFGGDSYNQASNMGMNVHYHINPKWSVGVKYSHFLNKLTPEGLAMIEKAKQAAEANPEAPDFLYPQVISPRTELLGMVNWYPIVGKLSFGSWGVAHFDTYLTAGYGTIELSNGVSPSASLGLGLGFWLNPNVTTRLEYRTQQHTAQYYTKTQEMLTSTASLQVGWML